MSKGARYDGVATWYDDFVRSADHTSVVLDAVERLLGPGPGRCLDVGCGTGIAFSTLSRLNWSVVGVDISADQLSKARTHAELNGAEVVEADATDLPFEPGSFDAAISLLTHTDFDDLDAAFSEMSRVLRPGGRFVYVGVHPWFAGPSVERHARGPHLLNPGYRQEGWREQAQGPVRERVGVNHVPLASLLNAMLESGIRVDRVEEPGVDDYPLLIAVAATR